MKTREYTPDPRFVRIIQQFVYDPYPTLDELYLEDPNKSMHLFISEFRTEHCEGHHTVQAVCQHGHIVLNIGMDKVRDVCHDIAEEALRTITGCKCKREILHSVMQPITSGPPRKPSFYIAKAMPK